MSENNPQKKPALILLAVVALGIWGTVLFRFTGYLTGESSEGSVADESVSTPALTDQLPRFQLFKGDYPDPFVPVQLSGRLDSNNEAMPDSLPPSEPVAVPVYYLQGVIGQTALFRTENDPAIHFANEGDNLAGMEILSVEKDSVVVRSEAKVKTMRIKSK